MKLDIKLLAIGSRCLLQPTRQQDRILDAQSERAPASKPAIIAGAKLHQPDDKACCRYTFPFLLTVS